MNRDKAEGVIKEALDLMARKNADYGSDNISTTGLYGLSVRLTDKVHRLLNLTKPNGAAPHFESVGDTFMDVMNYGLIGTLLLQGHWDDKIPTFSDYEEDTIKSVYLAGSIDAVGREYATSWRKEAASRLSACGVGSFDPTAAYSPGGDEWPSPMMRQVNRAAIASCSGFLVNLTDSKGFGTIREIEFAAALGKTIVVWGDEVELASKIEAYDLKLVYPDLETCVDVMWSVLCL